MSRNKELIDTLVTEHATLTAGALLVRNLAWMMEQTFKTMPRVGPELPRFIADGMLERLNPLEEAVDQLKAAPGGEA